MYAHVCVRILLEDNWSTARKAGEQTGTGEGGLVRIADPAELGNQRGVVPRHGRYLLSRVGWHTRSSCAPGRGFVQGPAPVPGIVQVWWTFAPVSRKTSVRESNIHYTLPGIGLSR